MWALGCVIYQMLEGNTPFINQNREMLFKNILNDEISFPNYFSTDSKDVILNLLQKNVFLFYLA